MYWDTIGPRQSRPYAWDRPAIAESRILSVRFPDGKREEERHIRLDAIGEKRGIRLQVRGGELPVRESVCMSWVMASCSSLSSILS